jgi:2-amino-4-hydroxy-6-hydroxymethyldihydropteridine diphosphokinase
MTVTRCVNSDKPAKTRCYIGLGSNLDDPIQQLQTALQTLSQLKDIQLQHCSSFYRSEPLGPSNQPLYTNAVAALTTTQNPMDLLVTLQRIEQAHGRQRHIEWGPRTLDLDLLLYGQQCIDLHQLIIPHPHMHERDFVLIPLQEIAPQLQIPNQPAIIELLNHCCNTHLQKIILEPMTEVTSAL